MAQAPDYAEAGRLLFAQECDFIWAASKIDGLPPMGPPEIAFAGRSNVGKSSLLNALTNRKSLARTSHTPGRTQELNFFDLGTPGAPRLRLVDMPGYGYARVSQTKVDAWTELMRGFLRGRATLLRTYVLIDGRHGVKPVDHDTFSALDAAAMSYQVVLTKRDEVKPAAVEPTMTAALAALAMHPAAHPEILFVSSHAGIGMPQLRAAIAQALAERGY